MVNYSQTWGKLAVLLALSAQVPKCSAVIAKYITQSFFFDWNKEGQQVPIPTTEQCEVIHIKWSRSTATGPSSTAPYFLQVYTSAYTTPFIIPAGGNLSFDWAVPFTPGTQYQICMFDKFGNTGGCQAIYTVIPPKSNPTCTNVTAPPLLDVQALDVLGPLSQFGWPEQCTDISVMPKAGTPPYTLTVAPALHPPYNLTSNDQRPINWTLSLTWASPFFVSMVDSAGNMWTNGPLHVGASGTSSTACLVGNSTEPAKQVGQAVAIGSGVGGLAVGLAIGILAMWLIMRRKAKKREFEARFAAESASPQPLMSDSQYRPIPTQSSTGVLSNNTMSDPSSTMMHRMGSTNYQVEPFHMPDEEGRMYNNAGPSSPGSVYAPSITGQRMSTIGHETNTGPNSSIGAGSSSQPQRSATSGRAGGPSQVYVVHHDAQAAPVTIYHQQGTQIVELPPRYPAGAPSSDLVSEATRSASDGRSDASRTDASRTDGGPSLVLHQPRQPGSILKPLRGGGH